MKVESVEIKRERFTKVAEKRVQKIIGLILHLQECSSRNRYEYDMDDINLMINEMTKALNKTKSVFKKQIKKEEDNKKGFKFKNSTG